MVVSYTDIAKQQQHDTAFLQLHTLHVELPPTQFDWNALLILDSLWAEGNAREETLRCCRGYGEGFAPRDHNP